MNCKIPDVQAGFRKGRGTRDQTANILWIIKTVRVPEKHLLWALESITTNKASGDDGIPVELFQILKDDAALNMPANLEKAVATGLEKVRFHSNPKERQCQRMLKLPHNCTHLTC